MSKVNQVNLKWLEAIFNCLYPVNQSQPHWRHLFALRLQPILSSCLSRQPFDKESWKDSQTDGTLAWRARDCCAPIPWPLQKQNLSQLLSILWYGCIFIYLSSNRHFQYSPCRIASSAYWLGTASFFVFLLITTHDWLLRKRMLSRAVKRTNGASTSTGRQQVLNGALTGRGLGCKTSS